MAWLKQVFGQIKGLVQPGPQRALTLEEALPLLVPKVRPRFLYEAIALEEDKVGPAFQPLAELFALTLTLDGPDWALDVTEGDLRRWGADFERLLQRARTNLLQRGGEERFRQVRPGLFRSTWRDNLDGSRALLPGMLRGLRLRGDPVVVLPDRDTLLVAGSEDAQALGWMLEGAMACLRGAPDALNGCPLRWSGYHWEAWEAAPGHPAAPLMARVQNHRLLEEYAHQKRLLERRLGQSGTPVAVAPFRLGRTPSGAVASCTFLPQGNEEGWLPEVDRVGLLGGDSAHPTCRWVAWGVARRRLGSHLEPMGLFPERYRVLAGPERVAALLGPP